MKDLKTLSAYDQRAGDYARLTGSGSVDAAYQRFTSALPTSGRILDFGCGPGHVSARLISDGFNVDAWDGSGEMVAMAQSQHGVEVRHASFDDLNAVDLYDGIWAGFSLLHATKADFPRHLEACQRALKPGGILHISMKLGRGEARDTLGRFYAYYSQQELDALLVDAGFSPGFHLTGKTKGLAGGVEPFIEISANA